MAPSFHLMFSASRPFIAAHVFCAITATPASGWNAEGIGVSLISTTLTTPGTFMAAAASKEATLPP